MADSTSQNLGMHGNAEMNAIGWIIGLGCALLLIPLAPFVLAYLVVDWIVGEAGPDRGGGPPPKSGYRSSTPDTSAESPEPRTTEH